MNFQRRQHNLTVLADGSVLATGGYENSSEEFFDLTTAVFAAELWDPATEQWDILAEMTVARMYHSTALLLPDGRVLSAGGGLCTPCKAKGYLEKNAEIFSPPYLFKKDGSGALAPRPVINSPAPSAIVYAQLFDVKTAEAPSIEGVAMVALGAVTHSTNMAQRYVPLEFSPGAGKLQVLAPANGNIAPPGYYMLFILDDDGVPSVAKIVKISA